jgi:hypothetical protein
MNAREKGGDERDEMLLWLKHTVVANRVQAERRRALRGIEARCHYNGRCRTWVKATGRPSIWRNWMNDVNASLALPFKDS